jgi:hypothetical protein
MVAWLHLVLLVAVRVSASTCRNPRGTDPGVLQDHGGQQPQQRAVGAKLAIAGLHERLGHRRAAMLDLTDVLQRVADAVTERLQRQVLRLATPTKLRTQPRGT